MSMDAIKQESMELFLCERFNAKITLDACKQYQESSGQCGGCKQTEKVINVEKIRICKKCKSQILGKNHKDMCSSCYGKYYREKEKREKEQLMKQVEEMKKESATSNNHNGLVVVLDFTDHSDLLEQVKIEAKKEFRHPDQQLLYWAQEFCRNNSSKAEGV